MINFKILSISSKKPAKEISWLQKKGLKENHQVAARKRASTWALDKTYNKPNPAGKSGELFTVWKHGEKLRSFNP